MGSLPTTTWFQIVLADPDLLKGHRVIEVMNLLLAAVPADVAVLTGAEWGGFEVDKLKDRAGSAVVVTPEELARRIGIYVHFRWGTIFLTTDNRQKKNPIVAEENIAVSLSKSLFGIRCVDTSVLFIYSPYAEHCEILRGSFLVEEEKAVPFSDLVFPY